MDFSSLSLSNEILSVVQELGFLQMTPIQAQGIPVLLSGKDLIGRSRTGSGKTAAFVIPSLQQIDLNQRTIQVLILCPTRELSAQVAKETRKLGRRFVDLQVVVLYGGVPAREQIQSLQSGPQIVVGTPGRILDLASRGLLDFSSLKVFILDEADKMLEMGFEDELLSLLKRLPMKRQTALFSATFPDTLKDISKIYQRNPIEISIETPNEQQSSIEQVLYEYDGNENRVHILMRILQQHPAGSTLIFCNQKTTVNEILGEFTQQGVPVGALHGDLEQRERDRVVSLFRNGSYRVLVATDVAARGLDIDHLELVINFDFPQQIETYIHRIGRTGRAGKTGTAVLLAKHSDTLKVMEIEQATQTKFIRPKLGFKNQHSIAPSHGSSAMQTLSISAGRKEKLRPGDILGALTNPSIGLKSSEVGKIEVMDHHSLVAISATQAPSVLKKLKEGKIKGRRFQIKLIKS